MNKEENEILKNVNKKFDEFCKENNIELAKAGKLMGIFMKHAGELAREKELQKID